MEILDWDIYGLNGWDIYGLNGWDIYGLNGWGIYGLNGWGKVSYCFFWWECAQKCWSSGEYPFQSSHMTTGFGLFELP